MIRSRTSRRGFLAGAATLLATPLRSPADQKPKIVNPRATDGDDRAEPRWDEKLTISVGQKDGDLIGKDDKVIQAAVDYMKRVGGGTVRILPGTYTLRNSVFLSSGIRILGSGADTILTKIASESVELAQDSDWYDQEVTLKNAKGFKVGDGVVFQAKNPHNGGSEVIKRTLIAKSGNRFKLSDGLRKNLWLSGKPTCASLFPLLTSEHTADVVIENLALDGNRPNNTNLNGNYAGCIFLQDCNRYTIRSVIARNYNGDGISFQICHDVVIHDCHSHGNAGLGLHPGSGSQRPVLRRNRLEQNNLGLFWCWGVKFGLAEDNQIADNSSYGISIGHNDTDNIMRNNRISNSGKAGILFRNDARGQDFWANRNLIENNQIHDSGGEEGIGIDIQGQTKDVRIVSNQIRESRAPMKRVGLRIGPEVQRLSLDKNRIEGYAQPIADLRTS